MNFTATAAATTDESFKRQGALTKQAQSSVHARKGGNNRGNRQQRSRCVQGVLQQQQTKPFPIQTKPTKKNASGLHTYLELLGETRSGRARDHLVKDVEVTLALSISTTNKTNKTGHEGSRTEERSRLHSLVMLMPTQRGLGPTNLRRHCLENTPGSTPVPRGPEKERIAVKKVMLHKVSTLHARSLPHLQPSPPLPP